MPRTARLLAAAVVIALPLLLASCSRTYSNGHEFRNGTSFAALKADGSVVAWGAANRGGDPACVVNTSSCGAAPTGSLSSGVTSIFSSYGAYAALKSDGSLVVWGGASHGGEISCTLGGSLCHPVSLASLSSGVRTVSSTQSAFAAVKTDGSVLTWGQITGGGDASCTPAVDCSPAPPGSLSSGVAQIFGGSEAFAALKTDGSAVAWGNAPIGGDASEPVGGTLTGLTDIVPNSFAFAARTSGGGVITWGDDTRGGDPNCSAPCSPAAPGSLTSGVAAINSTNEAFAARKSDGTVVSWGSATAGGDSSDPKGGALTGVTTIFASTKAFAALRSDGSVVTWGDSAYGGDASCAPGASCSPAPAASLASGVTAIFANEMAFAALKQDGSVVTWGAPGQSLPPGGGGDSACDPTPGTCTPAPTGSLSGGVTQIMWTQDAFVARKQDGSVVTWGATAAAGNSSAPVGGALTGVSQVFSNVSAGAALRDDGSVVTWGGPDSGGDPGCDPTSQACSPAPPGSLSSGVIYIASPFVDAPTPPSAPTSLVATAGDASASIAFMAGAANGQPITGYEYSLNEGAWTAASPATTTSPVVINGLTNGTTYGVRLRALNSRGAGPTSTSVNVTPVAATPSVPALAGRTTCDRLVCTTRGRVPPGATRVTQVAAVISTAAQHRARTNAATSTRRVRGKCTIAGSGTARTYTCTIRLSRGRWAITTTALKGSTVAARSVKNVRISRVAPKRAVTG